MGGSPGLPDALRRSKRIALTGSVGENGGVTAEQVVVAVHASPKHTFNKRSLRAITLHEGLGVLGDAHYGATVKHRSRVAADPSQPNLRRLTIGQGVINQINTFQPGLLKQVVHTTDDGALVRLAGVMGMVSRSGETKPGDTIAIDLPPEPRFKLTRV